MSTTITLTIGLNSNQTLQPLPSYVASRFRDAIDALLLSSGATVFVRDAGSSGTWQDVNSGQTVHEESRTWVAAITSENVWRIRDALPGLCEQYEQDAIAFTTGTTELVGLRQPASV